MGDVKVSEAKIFQYEFEVPINKPAEDVWPLLATQIDAWWMADFRALGEGSVMSLDLSKGGALVETGKDGSTLEWYRVQMFVPEQSIYFVGYMAPDWGGPTISMLKLSLKPDGDKCTLTVSDALLGNTTEGKMQSAKSGWQMMFAQGFKGFAEH